MTEDGGPDFVVSFLRYRPKAAGRDVQDRVETRR